MQVFFFLEKICSCDATSEFENVFQRAHNKYLLYLSYSKCLVQCLMSGLIFEHQEVGSQN